MWSEVRILQGTPGGLYRPRDHRSEVDQQAFNLTVVGSIPTGPTGKGIDMEDRTMYVIMAVALIITGSMMHWVG